MPASSIGPSWAQRGSREARLAFRQAQKRGDREGAMRIAGEADKQGLASQASIGSAEERLADQYQGRGADTAVTAEIETALTPPGLSRDMIDTPAGPRRRAEEFSSPATTPRTVQPSIPEQPPAPGASQPPENPVTGTAKPQTGDAESRLGMRKVNPLTGKPIGYDPRNPEPTGAAGSDDDFLDRVGQLTAAEGENLTRGDAVRKVNSERAAAGKAPRNYDDMIGGLQTRDREKDRTNRTASSLNRGPVLSVDPTLARSFRDAAPMAEAAATTSAASRAARSDPAPSRRSFTGGSPMVQAPAPPPAPLRRKRTLDDALQERFEFVEGYSTRERPAGPNAFQGSRAQKGAEAAGQAISEGAASVTEGAKKRAAGLAKGVRKKVKGTAFEGSPVARLLGIS